MRVRTAADWPESEYRAEIKKVTDFLTRQVDALDPNLVEAEESHGVLTITFGDGTRVILSAQPPKRQLWVAMASTGTAVHYEWAETGMWIDEKRQQRDVYALLADVIGKKLGQTLTWGSPE